MRNSLKWILVAILILTCLGVLVIASLSSSEINRWQLLKKQVISLAIAFGAYFVFRLVDYRLFRNSSYFLLVFYFFSVFMMGLVLFFGTKVNGITGWLHLGFFNFQPVELAKLAVILILAKYFSNRNIEIWQFKHILISGMYAAIPAILAILQPDLGGAAIIIGIWFCVLLLAGLRLKQFLLLLLIFAILLTLSWQYFLKPYQKTRLISFFNSSKDWQGSQYNARQAMIAIGSGGLFGKGLGWGTQTQLRFLPAAQTDFIFSSLGEELGFVGVVLVLGSFSIIFYNLAQIGLNLQENFTKLAVMGIAINLSLNFIINLGMNLGVIPIVGLPLPFVSFGGSHLLMELMAVGFISNIVIQNS
jgi:rod shape determining protein RodA